MFVRCSSSAPSRRVKRTATLDVLAWLDLVPILIALASVLTSLRLVDEIVRVAVALVDEIVRVAVAVEGPSEMTVSRSRAIACDAACRRRLRRVRCALCRSPIPTRPCCSPATS